MVDARTSPSHLDPDTGGLTDCPDSGVVAAGPAKMLEIDETAG